VCRNPTNTGFTRVDQANMATSGENQEARADHGLLRQRLSGGSDMVMVPLPDPRGLGFHPEIPDQVGKKKQDLRGRLQGG
jgi:hypothetical protein